MFIVTFFSHTFLEWQGWQEFRDETVVPPPHFTEGNAEAQRREGLAQGLTFWNSNFHSPSPTLPGDLLGTSLFIGRSLEVTGGETKQTRYKQYPEAFSGPSTSPAYFHVSESDCPHL